MQSTTPAQAERLGAAVASPAFRTHGIGAQPGSRYALVEDEHS